MRANLFCHGGFYPLSVPSLAPELAIHCAEFAADSLDPEALEVCVAVLKRAVGYYLRLITRDTQGKLHLPLAESPECESLLPQPFTATAPLLGPIPAGRSRHPVCDLPRLSTLLLHAVVD